MSVHILGGSGTGMLLAHELAQAAIVPTMVYRFVSDHTKFLEAGSAITLTRPDFIDTHLKAVEIDSLYQERYLVPQEYDTFRPWENLLVTQRSYEMEAALKRCSKYITPDTNVILVQNGMGILDRLFSRTWPNPAQRPKIYQAFSTLGALRLSLNEVHHTGRGSLLMTKTPGNLTNMWKNGYPGHNAIAAAASSSQPDLPVIQALLERSNLNSSMVDYRTFLLKQMENLIVTNCIGPLTAILDCTNGDLLYGKAVTPIMRAVINECLLCLRREFRTDTLTPESSQVLHPDRLLELVIVTCRETATANSVMHDQVKFGKRTEIEAYNKYISHLGIRYGIPTPFNDMFVQMISSKQTIDMGKEDSFFKRFG